ncbi:hypothetical protein IWQ61_005637 [Dispira simplex]|nr:hypothetical protein IWQ61_005637 [Dispira simplex]
MSTSATHPPAYQAIPTSEPTAPTGGDDIPDDFKFGTVVAQCDRDIRHSFLRKVYSILTGQLLLTTVFCSLFLFNSTVQVWVFQHLWTMYVGVVVAFISLLGLLWKRRSYPTNFILLTAFTVSEAYTLGFVVSLHEIHLVLQALVLTLGLFVILTLFTIQSRYDFSQWGSILGFGLWGLILVGLVQLFLPFNRTFDLVMAIGTAILFCGYIMYDTHLILHRLSPEEYIVAAVDLYLDIVNLFLAILRILSDSRNN